MKFRRRFITVLAVVIIGLSAYGFGFIDGQESVYEKAKNDQNFYEDVWGGGK